MITERILKIFSLLCLQINAYFFSFTFHCDTHTHTHSLLAEHLRLYIQCKSVVFSVPAQMAALAESAVAGGPLKSG